MRTRAQLFDECLATVKNNVKMELDMPFALADKVQPPIHVLYSIAEILNVDVRTLLIPNKIKE